MSNTQSKRIAVRRRHEAPIREAALAAYSHLGKAETAFLRTAHALVARAKQSLTRSDVVAAGRELKKAAHFFELYDQLSRHNLRGLELVGAPFEPLLREDGDTWAEVASWGEPGPTIDETAAYRMAYNVVRQSWLQQRRARRDKAKPKRGGR